MSEPIHQTSQPLVIIPDVDGVIRIKVASPTHEVFEEVLDELDTLSRELLNDTRAVQPFERRNIAQRIEGIVRRFK